LVLAILDGHHALYKVGQRLEERGMLTLLQPGLTRASLHDDRLGHILDALFAANLNKVFSPTATLERIGRICARRIAVLRLQATRESNL
jgi:hypothetical protein